MENSFDNENILDNEELENEEIEPEKKGKSMQREIMEWIVAFLVAVVLAMIIRTFLFTLVAVSGSSMEGTLHDGERLVISRLNYSPEQGDIIVFTPDMYPETPFIKRIIATEGQTVDIDSRGVVYVDGKVYDEDYISADKTLLGDVVFPITVPEDCVFVMGDNRTPNGSHDGRSLDVSSIKEDAAEEDYYSFIHHGNGITREEAIYYGCVHKDDIMGKAVLRFWPFDRFGLLK